MKPNSKERQQMHHWNSWDTILNLHVVEDALNEPKSIIFTIRNPSERFKDVKIINIGLEVKIITY